jgi:molybdopterin synthase catalytic subunit
MALCRLTSEPIDPRQAEAAVGGPDRGAVAGFLGVVRDHHEGRRVVRIEYHAYVPMAEATLREIAAEAEARFGTPHVAIVHRTGDLGVGDISLQVAVAAVHRREALEACAFVVEEVKMRAPIWKKEFGEGGAFWIEGPDSHRSAGPPSLRPPEGG